MYLKCSINVSIVIITIIIKSLTDVISLNSYNIPAKKVLSSSSYKTKGRRKEVSEFACHCTGRGQGRQVVELDFWTCVCLTPEPNLFTVASCFLTVLKETALKQGFPFA